MGDLCAENYTTQLREVKNLNKQSDCRLRKKKTQNR